MKQKSTDIGYINKNNQKNLGRTDKPGTDHNQYFYEMECLNCDINIMLMEVIYGIESVLDVKVEIHKN